MKIIFSEHSLKRIKERNLNKSIIRRTIISPDFIKHKEKNRFYAFKKIFKNDKIYLLIVVYDKINKEIKVITSFITSKVEKYLKII